VQRRRIVLFDDQSRLLDRFGAVLVINAVSIVVLSLVDLTPREGSVAGGIGIALANAVVALAVLLALRASGLARRPQRIVDVLVLVGVVGWFAIAVLPSFGDPIPELRAPLFTVLLAILLPIAIVRRLLRHTVVTTRTVIGSIAGYLAIPLAFYYGFLSVYALTGEFFAEPEPTTAFMYFSLTSVSTLGFGDLVATTDLGRLLSTSEAIVGQVYLVAFVALIVGRYAASRWAGPTDA
jgi:hypothetical protein